MEITVALIVACAMCCLLTCEAVRRSVAADGAILRPSSLNASAQLIPDLDRALQFLTFILEAPGKAVGRQRGHFPESGMPNYRVLAQGAATAHLLTPHLLHATPTMWDGDVRDGSFWAIDKAYAAIGMMHETTGKVSVFARMLTYNTPRPALGASFVLFQNRDGSRKKDDLLGRAEGLRSAIEDLDKTRGEVLLPGKAPNDIKGNVVAAWRFCNYVNPDLAHNPPEYWAGELNYLPYAQSFAPVAHVYMKYLEGRGQICNWKEDVTAITCGVSEDPPVPSFYDFVRSMLEKANPTDPQRRPGRITRRDWNDFLINGRTWKATKFQQMLKVDEYEVVACKTPGRMQNHETVFDLLGIVEWRILYGRSRCKANSVRKIRGISLHSCKAHCKRLAFQGWGTPKVPACTVIAYRRKTRKCKLYATCDPVVFLYTDSGYKMYELTIPTEQMVAEWMNRNLLAQAVPWPLFSIDFMSWAPTAWKKLSLPADVVVHENEENLRTLFAGVGDVDTFIRLLASPQPTRDAEAIRISQLRRIATTYMEALENSSQQIGDSMHSRFATHAQELLPSLAVMATINQKSWAMLISAVICILEFAVLS